MIGGGCIFVVEFLFGSWTSIEIKGHDDIVIKYKDSLTLDL